MLLRHLDDNNLPITFESEILNQLTRQISQYNPNDIIFEGEIIKTIKLDIRLEDKLITDQFDWDINNPNNKPEVNHKDGIKANNTFLNIKLMCLVVKLQLAVHLKLLLTVVSKLAERRQK